MSPRHIRRAGHELGDAVWTSSAGRRRRRYWRTTPTCRASWSGLAADPLAADMGQVAAGPAGRAPVPVTVSACESFVDDDAAEAFARRFCLYGTADEIAARLTELNRSGVAAVLLQHVGSYDLP